MQNITNQNLGKRKNQCIGVNVTFFNAIHELDTLSKNEFVTSSLKRQLLDHKSTILKLKHKGISVAKMHEIFSRNFK